MVPRVAVWLSLVSVALACGPRDAPKFHPELTHVSQPEIGVLPFFRGPHLDPYWPRGRDLPGDLRAFPDLTLISHENQPFAGRAVRGSYTLILFFYATCAGICPMTTANLKWLYSRIPDAKETRFLSITVNPELDDPTSLRQFRARYGITQDNWLFLTGTRPQIEGLAREQFGADVQTREGQGGLLDFVHTENVFLLDKQGYLRGVYRARGTGDLERLLADLKLLRGRS